MLVADDMLELKKNKIPGSHNKCDKKNCKFVK